MSIRNEIMIVRYAVSHCVGDVWLMDQLDTPLLRASDWAVSDALDEDDL